MDRLKMIADIQDLWLNHKRATSLDFEYTELIYDFLIEEGKIDLTKEQKIVIFGKAKNLYKAELEIAIKTGTIKSMQQAQDDLKLVTVGKLNDRHKLRCVELSKIISVKEFFDSNETQIKF